MFKKSFSKPSFGGKSGGSRFGGGSKPWERSSEGPRSMHSATCSECNQRCEVPFKPNGKKPIFCSNCFRKDEGDAPKRSFGGDNNYAPREPRESRGGGMGMDAGALNDQLKAIQNKLDAIIRALDV